MEIREVQLIPLLSDLNIFRSKVDIWAETKHLFISNKSNCSPVERGEGGKKKQSLNELARSCRTETTEHEETCPRYTEL